MLILGIETATEQVSVAIGGHEGVLGSFELTRGRRHAETLVPAIEFLCNQAGIEIAEFSAIAVDIGPGLFTGMRVGIAAGKAIAQALRIPMIGISSLDLLAFPLRYSDRTIAAVIDARKGEVFTAFYRTVPGGVQRVTEPRCSSVDDLVADDWDAERVLWQHFAAHRAQADAVVVQGVPLDALGVHLPEQAVTTVHEHRWMLRIVDAAAAIAARGYPASVRAAVPLELDDAHVARNSGRFVLRCEDGTARLEPGGDGAVRCSVNTLSVLYASGAATRSLAAAGLLPGAHERHLQDLEAVFAGARPAMRDDY